MDIYQAIGARRTIRDFEPRGIDRAVLEKILWAGLRAPMHDPKEGRRFVLVEGAALRAELVRGFWRERSREETVAMVDSWEPESPEQRAMLLDALPKQASMLLSAGALVIPCFLQTEPLLDAKTSLHQLNSFAEAWACLENMLVAAAAEGILGVTKIPSTPSETAHIRRTLGIPGEYEIACYLALGYPRPGAPSFGPQVGEVGHYVFRDAWGVAEGQRGGQDPLRRVRAGRRSMGAGGRTRRPPEETGADRAKTLASLLRRIAVLCPFVASAAGSRCLAARGCKKEIEWVSERDGWSTYGILI